MDKSVPAGAAHLLAFIYRTETGHDAPQCYEVIYGHKQDKLRKPITSMTLDEIEAAQGGWSKRFGSSATGAAQFMKNTLDAPGTLKDIEGEMELTGKELFTPDLQDRMAFHLLRLRGYEAFIAGKLSLAAFGKKLAQEWASFPVLADTRGAKRAVKRGQSYYAGDGLNKSLVSPAEVEHVLGQVLAIARRPPVLETHEPAEVVVPDAGVIEDHEAPIGEVTSRSRPGWLAMAVIAALALLVGAAVWFLGGSVTPAEAPVPLPRPQQLLGRGDRSIWADIGLQVVLAFAAPLAAAIATAAVGWVTYWWGRLFKANFDQKSAQSLHDALERGLLAAIDIFGKGKAARPQLLAAAAGYAQRFNGGTVKRFKLTDADLELLAAPHLARLSGSSTR